MSETEKTQTGSDSAKPQRKRRTRLPNDKKIADDEFMAAAIGDVEWLKQSLREAKGQINFDKNGLAALHLAAIHGRLECLKLLLEKYKININLPSTTGWRAVHLCISNQTGKRALQCLTYLLNKSADPSVPNNDGITPIHQAASEGHVQCLKLLIEVGAKIDLKDCRGHSPLDLAKLWGHKKCARILAAEMWHQDKDHVAKEMGHLKKLKMQQLMKQMEDEEEYKAAQEFQGEKAFQEWLEKRKLQQSSTGPKGKENEKKDEKKDSLYKPNSKTAKPSGEFTSKKDQTKDDGSSKIYLNLDEKSSTSVEPDYRSRFHLREGTDLYKEPGAPQSPARRMSKERAKTATYTNPNTWKIPLKVPQREYVPNLTDDYPRDMYTIMPQVDTAPKYYDGKHGPAIYVTDEDAETKKVKKISERPADLPQEVINRVMSKDPTLKERPVYFKPKHIYDVDKKKKYDIDLKGRPEIPLHLGSDLTSALFRQSLFRQATTIDKGSITTPRSDKSSSVSSDWRNSSKQKENVVSMLNRMKKPARFPNIKGEEYDLNFGNIFVM